MSALRTHHHSICPRQLPPSLNSCTTLAPRVLSSSPSTYFVPSRSSCTKRGDLACRFSDCLALRRGVNEVRPDSEPAVKETVESLRLRWLVASARGGALLSRSRSIISSSGS